MVSVSSNRLFELLLTLYNIWQDTSKTSNAYEGQKGGKAINDAVFPNTGELSYDISCFLLYYVLTVLSAIHSLQFMPHNL